MSLTAAAPATLPASQLANGDIRFSVTYPAAQAYVEAFGKLNGTQNVSGNIVSSGVANPDGTFTYSRVVPASTYHVGDVINVRFYSYVSGGAGVFKPGPIDAVYYPDYVYGVGSTAFSSDCRPLMAQLPNGDVKVTITFATPQSYVEAFVRDNAAQVAAGNIVTSGVADFDGKFTYSRVVPAASFHSRRRRDLPLLRVHQRSDGRVHTRTDRDHLVPGLPLQRRPRAHLPVEYRDPHRVPRPRRSRSAAEPRCARVAGLASQGPAPPALGSVTRPGYSSARAPRCDSARASRRAGESARRNRGTRRDRTARVGPPERLPGTGPGPPASCRLLVRHRDSPAGHAKV